jgi:hypothetical protein
MAVDSNMPYQRVSVQANHNDTVWNGAAWGAGAGVGALGLTYGATTFGARGVDNLSAKVAGNKTTRLMTRNEKRNAAGKSHLTSLGLEEKINGVINKQLGVHTAMGRVQGFGEAVFGGKKRLLAGAATGLLGGMVAGAVIDANK